MCCFSNYTHCCVGHIFSHFGNKFWFLNFSVILGHQLFSSFKKIHYQSFQWSFKVFALQATGNQLHVQNKSYVQIGAKNKFSQAHSWLCRLYSCLQYSLYQIQNFSTRLELLLILYFAATFSNTVAVPCYFNYTILTTKLYRKRKSPVSSLKNLWGIFFVF